MKHKKEHFIHVHQQFMPLKNGDNIERMVKTSEIFLLYKKIRDQRDVPFWCKKKFYEIIGTALVEILCVFLFLKSR